MHLTVALTRLLSTPTEVDIVGLHRHSSLRWWHNRFFAFSTPLVMLKRSTSFKTTMTKRTGVHPTIFPSRVPPFTTCFSCTKHCVFFLHHRQTTRKDHTHTQFVFLPMLTLFLLSSPKSLQRLKPNCSLFTNMISIFSLQTRRGRP